MTNEEMRELDAWIKIHVFGWKLGNESDYPFRPCYFKDGFNPMLVADSEEFSTDPAASLEVLKKCAERMGAMGPIQIYNNGTHFGLSYIGNSDIIHAETIELAIALFAKELFKKETNE